MEVAITRMSSRGQVVIPAGMRDDLHEGDKILVIQNKDQIILKKATKADKNFEKDFEFAKRTEDAWKSYEKGEFVSMPAVKFLERLSKC
ncbi:AbrB/MazE/SpoVT family DNA-binding domain-containing protein [Candidatus Woesearchaeota archaeon]|nr:AbrB/MazE/SpoVT family DNA-binding domain-containing protein [Candidatus Woesearchaeota archaeon]